MLKVIHVMIDPVLRPFINIDSAITDRNNSAPPHCVLCSPVIFGLRTPENDKYHNDYSCSRILPRDDIAKRLVETMSRAR